MDEPNVVLKFQDERGNYWLAPAVVGTVIPLDHDGDHLEVESLKDRAFVLTGFTVVHR